MEFPPPSTRGRFDTRAFSLEWSIWTLMWAHLRVSNIIIKSIMLVSSCDGQKVMYKSPSCNLHRWAQKLSRKHAFWVLYCTKVCTKDMVIVVPNINIVAFCYPLSNAKDNKLHTPKVNSWFMTTQVKCLDKLINKQPKKIWHPALVFNMVMIPFLFRNIVSALKCYSK